ncbi:MAG: hypothetical protein L0H83_08455, partial [Salinisphaera sp.]|nr:hypothetical protein [Salinisphaera sp.]
APGDCAAARRPGGLYAKINGSVMNGAYQLNTVNRKVRKVRKVKSQVLPFASFAPFAVNAFLRGRWPLR